MTNEERIAAYELLFNILDNNENSSSSNSNNDDDVFRQKITAEISNRDTEYSNLLKHFVNITKIRNVLKEFFKWTFYLFVIYSVYILTRIIYSLFNKYISYADIKQILDSLPLLITAMVGFVSTIITIPVCITKYLFSTEEDKNITQIILHTQEHDTNGRQWAIDFKKIVEKLNENNSEINNKDSLQNTEILNKHSNTQEQEN